MTRRVLIPLLLLAAALPSTAAAQITGRVRYENRDYDGGGFVGTQFIPARRAKVELVNSDNGNSWFDTTDENGDYSITASDTGTFNVFIRVYASNDDGMIYDVKVRNNTTASAVYTSVSATVSRMLPNDVTALDLDVPFTNDTAVALNILDAAIYMYDYLTDINALAGTSNPSPLPKVRLYWEPGGTAGTFFDPGTNRVFLRGISADDDGWDDDIIMHELGHFISVNWGKDDSPGGFHSITDLVDPRLAWSEGWAHYFSSMLREYANTKKASQPGPPTDYVDPWTQVDVFSFGNSIFDIEAPSFPAQTITDENEVAVAASLWDVFDSVNEVPFDTLGSGTAGVKEIDIWDVFRNEIPTFSSITLEDFFKGWQNVSPADDTVVSGTNAAVGIMKDREIRFYPDTDEPNDGLSGAIFLGVVPPTKNVLERTFFSTTGALGVGDEDWYNFTLLADGFVRIETTNLRDAADTILELYDITGAVLLASSDDRSGNDPSSLIEISLTSSVYNLRIYPKGPAQFGTFDLKLEVTTNEPPTPVITASPVFGPALLLVQFTEASFDTDGIVGRVEWDFDGDGVYDYSSIEGGDVTHTYAEPGGYTATMRVTDNEGATSIASVSIVVASPTGDPIVTVTSSVTGSTAPVSVTFDAILSDIPNPVYFEWDFDTNGTIDASSAATATATHVYRLPGGYTARLFVTDDQGVRTRGDSVGITVAADPSAPTVTLSPSPNTGNLPLDVTFTATAGLTTYEWDLDGDGAIDRVTSTNVLTHTYLRVGAKTPTVTGIDAAGLADQATSTVDVTESSSVGGWMAYPKPGDTISGNVVTLVCEMRPIAQAKLVQFQHKADASPFGPWFDIGGSSTVSGSDGRRNFDTTGLINLEVRDIRGLVDLISTGDENLPNVQIDFSSPDILESLIAGLRIKDQLVRVDETVWMPTEERADLLFPARSATSATDITIRLEDRGDGGGSFDHPSLNRVGNIWEVTVLTGAPGFDNNYWIRLPYDDVDDNDLVDGSGDNVHILEILRWNGAAWVRVVESLVIRSVKQVRVRANREGIHAIFGGPKTATPGGGGGGGGSGGGALDDGSGSPRQKFVNCSAGDAGSARSSVPLWAALLIGLLGAGGVARRRLL